MTVTQPAVQSATVVLVGGHESADGADLQYLTHSVPHSIVTPAGRPLHNLVTRMLAADDRAVVVVPMTFGRNPTFVADTAKTLKWLAGSAHGRLALADPFGTEDHLTAWLRTAAGAALRTDPEAAMVIWAPAANPFDDAEVYRVAHLVRTHGAGNVVEVAVTDGPAGMVHALERVRLLGGARAVVVPAGFARDNPVPPEERGYAAFSGPLMSESGIVRVIQERVRDALHELGHGRNGIDAGLQADHGHGYAHSHAFEESTGHSHSHGDGTAHTHGGSADHSHAHGAHTPAH